ncbi:MAG: AraC family transcriptional regulator [Lachnospiraceae bacterium]|nr:AraC family transcriptional regulator [Lachnospiraceae bacterium]
MTYEYLLRQAALHLYTAARQYDENFRLVRLCRIDPELTDDEDAALILKSDLIRKHSESMPLVFTVNHDLIYGWVPSGEANFLLGPARFSGSLSFVHNLDVPGFDENSYAQSIPRSTLELFVEDLLLLFNLNRSGSKEEPFLIDTELLRWNCVSTASKDDTLKTLYNTIFENVENSFAHNPFNHEKRECNCIREGNVGGLKEILTERFPGRYGRLSPDPLKQEIYLGIVAITIASRAAIEGGLHPETAFYLSDISIQRLDACSDPNTALKTVYEAEIHYAELVAELKNAGSVNPAEENRHISHCKDYIFAHMHEKLTINDIARAIGLAPNYLSALFHKCEGKTLKQYILEEKVSLIKNMLTYSSYSYIQIAAYLGFSSQSHMGQEFKKVTGMTPRAFREKNAREDFLESLS